MEETPPLKENLSGEFRTLGRNLADALHSVLESPGRQVLQQEIEEGFAELVAALKKEAGDFRESPTGQQLKNDLEDLRQRIRTGEAESIARREILSALRKINTELEKASQRWKAPPDSGVKT